MVITIFNNQTFEIYLELGIWLLFDYWDLVIGDLDLESS
jgi:hypothetical protein